MVKTEIPKKTAASLLLILNGSEEMAPGLAILACFGISRLTVIASWRACQMAGKATVGDLSIWGIYRREICDDPNARRKRAKRGWGLEVARALFERTQPLAELVAGLDPDLDRKA